MPRLVVAEEGAIERSFEIHPPVAIVGSDAKCDVVIQGEDVSAEHCEIRAVMGAWKVVDLESRAGTRVNGAYVNQRPLNGGDVLDVGGVRVVFEDDPRGVPAARQDAAPAAAPGLSAARPGQSRPGQSRSGQARPAQAKRSPPPARRRRRADDRGGDDTGRSGREERPERPGTRRRRVKKRAAPVVVVLLTLVAAAALFGGVALMLSDSRSANQKVYMRMLKAQDELDWAEVMRASEGASAVGDHAAEIAALRVTAEGHLASEKDHARVGGSIKAWNQVTLWRQKNWKADPEYVERIDAFLTEYGDLAGASVDLARKERTRITGSSASGTPRNAQDAWTRTKADIASLTALGRFGESLTKLDEFETDWGSQAQALKYEAQKLKPELREKAKSWFAQQVSLAQRKADQGAWLQARRVLEKASENIGIPEYEERASEELKKILARRNQ